MKSVIVIGGGASGMMAAYIASKGGCDVTILEKKEQLGKKLSITGNGRCNILNENRSIKHFHGESPELIDEILRKVSNEDILKIFQKMGLFCRNKDGLYYPMSNKAQTVVGIFNEELKKNKINIKLGCNVCEIKKYDNKWMIYSNLGKFPADAVILAVGSPAGLSEKESYNGDSLLKYLGISYTSFKPSLCALTSKDKITKYWAGNRCEADITLYQFDTPVRKEHGELMLTEDGISGIAAFQLSTYYDKDSYVLIDFVPEISRQELLEIIKTNDDLKGKKLSLFYEGFLPSKLAATMVTETIFRNKIFYGCKAFELIPDYTNDNEANAIVDILKTFRVDINGVRNIKESQACKGGVMLNELNGFLKANNHDNLYITGELLDMVGDCGGYNLMWAWVTGIIAGNDVSK